MVKNSLATSMSSSSRPCMEARYCSVISEMKISRISTLAFVIRCKSRSSGPSNCLRETTYAMPYPHSAATGASSSPCTGLTTALMRLPRAPCAERTSTTSMPMRKARSDS